MSDEFIDDYIRLDREMTKDIAEGEKVLSEIRSDIQKIILKCFHDTKISELDQERVSEICTVVSLYHLYKNGVMP